MADSSLQDYLDEDPSVLSEKDLAGISSAFDLPIEKVKVIAKGMSAQRKKVASEQDSDSEGEGTGLLASATFLAAEIMRLEEAQKFSNLNSEDESSIQQIRDILKLDPELTREVAELVWSAGAVEPPSGAKTILPYWKAKSKKVAELASIEKEDFDD